MTHSTYRFSRISPLNRLTLAQAAALLVAAGSQPLLAKPTQPDANDRQITFAVSMLMEKDHLTGKRIDNTISERTLKEFIKDLDPLKLFFYKSDVDEFSRSKDNLDDQIKHGDIRFAYDVFARFLARVDERIQMAEAELQKPQDFSKDEEMVREPKELQFARTPEEAQDRWRQRVKFDLLKETADKVAMDEAIKN